MSKDFVISVMFRDRVGIVAEVTTAIADLKGNLEDISQTVMRGYFTMLMVASFPDQTKASDIKAALESLDSEKGATFGVMEFAESQASSAPRGELYMLTGAGPDAPGQVAAIARYLRERDINIVDLATTPNQGEYTMIFLVEIPKDTDVSKLKHSLQLDVARLGLKVEIRHHALFRKTNEI